MIQNLNPKSSEPAHSTADSSPASPGLRRRSSRLWIGLVAVLVVLSGVLWFIHANRPVDKRQQITSARRQLMDFRAALTAYNSDVGSYPDSLGALIDSPKGAAKWRGPYLIGPDKIPRDSWGHAYEYKIPGASNAAGYDLFSDGPDGKPGTADDIKD